MALSSSSLNLGFPASPGEITPRWINDVLHASGSLGPDHEVSSVRWSPLGIGLGFMGSVARLELDYEGRRGPVSSLVVKNAAPDLAMRELVRGYRNYEREVGFFRTIAPVMGDRVPTCYAAEIDVASNHFVVLLEDLGATFRDGDQVSGCSPDEARRCLDIQVELHARFWDARDRPGLAWVPRIDGEWFVPTMMGAFDVGWLGVLERFDALVPDALRSVGARFRDHLPGLMARVGRAPQTLVHSDFRLDNVMFARDPGSQAVKVLDWQGILVSAGVHDVAFLLSQNLDESLRASHEQDLVAYYHDGLVASGVREYSFDQVWHDYRLAVLLEWMYAVVIGGSLPMTDDRSRDLFAAIVGRSGRAICELDALALLPVVPA